MKISPFPLLVLTLIFALGVSPLVSAEETPPATQAPADTSQTAQADPEKVRKILEKTAAHIETLGSLQDEIARVDADLEKAKDEDLVVLREQRRRKYTELRDVLEGLVKNIIELEAAGSGQRDTRGQKGGCSICRTGFKLAQGRDQQFPETAGKPG